MAADILPLPTNSQKEDPAQSLPPEREGFFREALGLSEHAKWRKRRKNKISKEIKHEQESVRSWYKNERSKLLAQFREREIGVNKAITRGYTGKAKNKKVWQEAGVRRHIAETNPQLAEKKLRRDFARDKRAALNSLKKQRDQQYDQIAKQIRDRYREESKQLEEQANQQHYDNAA